MSEVAATSATGEEEMLSVSHLTGVTPRSEKTVYMFEAESTVGYKLVEPGDLVINTMWAWMGAAGTARVGGIVSPAYGVYRIDSSIADPRWVDYVIRTPGYVAEMTRYSRGVTSSRLRLYPDELLKLSMLVPPLAEQRAIANYLDAETARIDALVAKKQQLIHLLDERVDSLVFQGISGRLTSVDAPSRDSGVDWLGPIPRHFGTPTLGANFTTQLGKMLNAEAAAGPDQYPYVKNTNVRWDSFDLSDLPTMSFEAGDRTRCELRTGDLLVCEGGEVGRSAIWPGFDEPIYFQKALHRVRPVQSGNTRFLMYCLWAAASLDVFSVDGNQATIVHLTGEKLREHRFPWPPAAEQEEIVRRIDEARSEITALNRRLETQLDLLAQHRQALITAAVTGEFAVPGAA